MTTLRRILQGATVTLTAAAGIAATPAAIHRVVPPQATPQSVADELLAADRAYSAASANTDLVSGISAMFADKVIVPLPSGNFAYTAADAKAALQATPDNAKSRASWTPIRVGVSADGQHGFTFGYMTVTNPDGTTWPAKYMAYWIREPGRWKVAAYKRRKVEKAGAPTMMAPALPARSVPPTRDAATLRSHYQSVVGIENSFSSESQKIGLGIAFQRYGRADAVNMGPPSEPGFVVSAEAIGKSVVGGGALDEPSPVHWGADTALVASSGDLGITFGVIRQHKPATPTATGFPFFTIWYRASTSDPWRYIAE
jgi:ketosteroid isomerase-like protein